MALTHHDTRYFAPTVVSGPDGEHSQGVQRAQRRRLGLPPQTVGVVDRARGGDQRVANLLHRFAEVVVVFGSSVCCCGLRRMLLLLKRGEVLADALECLAGEARLDEARRRGELRQLTRPRDAERQRRRPLLWRFDEHRGHYSPRHGRLIVPPSPPPSA